MRGLSLDMGSAASPSATAEGFFGVVGLSSAWSGALSKQASYMMSRILVFLKWPLNAASPPATLRNQNLLLSSATKSIQTPRTSNDSTFTPMPSGYFCCCSNPPLTTREVSKVTCLQPLCFFACGSSGELICVQERCHHHCGGEL